MSKGKQKTKKRSKSPPPDSESQSDDSIVQASLREDGTLDFNLSFKKRLDLSEKLGRLGWAILLLGPFSVIFSPIMYFSGFITSAALMLAIMTAPFAVGAGVITAANSFEYFPFTK